MIPPEPTGDERREPVSAPATPRATPPPGSAEANPGAAAPPGEVDTPIASPPPPDAAAPAISPPVADPAAPSPIPGPVRRPGFFAERPAAVVEIPRSRLAAQTRRDFLLWSLGAVAAAGIGWWLLPDRARARLLPALPNDRLDTLAARLGWSGARRERALDRALTFDDDVAEALYSRDRMVRTYDRSHTGPLRNNYDGRTPGPEYLPAWRLTLSGLASGRSESLGITELTGRFGRREQVTRLVCVEGWSAVAWWGGLRFADLLAAFPPAPGARWAAITSSVNLDGAGRPDPYYVSIDLGTARHPQTLLATHLSGTPLTVEHGAPLRLVAPMKLGLKNIKAITAIEYTATEPRDYWNERGYSRYDGL